MRARGTREIWVRALKKHAQAVRDQHKGTHCNACEPKINSQPWQRRRAATVTRGTAKAARIIRPATSWPISGGAGGGATVSGARRLSARESWRGGKARDRRRKIVTGRGPCALRVSLSRCTSFIRPPPPSPPPPPNARAAVRGEGTRSAVTGRAEGEREVGQIKSEVRRWGCAWTCSHHHRTWRRQWRRWFLTLDGPPPRLLSRLSPFSIFGFFFSNVRSRGVTRVAVYRVPLDSALYNNIITRGGEGLSWKPTSTKKKFDRS